MNIVNRLTRQLNMLTILLFELIYLDPVNSKYRQNKARAG